MLAAAGRVERAERAAAMLRDGPHHTLASDRLSSAPQAAADVNIR